MNTVRGERLVSPAPAVERARPFPLEVTAGGAIVYAHGKSIYTVAEGAAGEVRNPHNTTVARMAPNGAFTAIGDATGTVRILATDETVKFDGQLLGGAINDICWSPDSDFVAVAGEGRGVYAAAVNLEGKLLGEFAGPAKACSTVTVGRGRIAVGCDDFSVYVYEGPPFRLARTLRQHTRFVSAVKFGPNGKLVTAGADGKLYLHGSDDGESAIEITERCKSPVKVTITGVDWVGEKLFTSSTDGIIRCWEYGAGTCKASEAMGQQVLGVRAQLGKLFIVLLDGTLCVLDGETFAVKSRHIGHSRTISALKIVNGAVEYSADMEGRLIDWTRGTFVASNDDGYGISSIVEVDGKIRAASGLAGKVFCIAGGTSVAMPPATLGQFSVSGNLVVVTAKAVSVLDSQSGAAKAVLRLSDEATGACAHNQFLYYVSTAKAVSKVQVTGQEAKITDTFELQGIAGSISAIAVHGDLLAIGDNQRRVYLFNTATKTMVPTKWCFHNSTISCLAWAPDGRRLLSGGLDNNLLLWAPDVPVKPVAEVRNAHAGTISVVQWLSGDQFCSCGTDATLRHWRID